MVASPASRGGGIARRPLTTATTSNLGPSSVRPLLSNAGMILGEQEVRRRLLAARIAGGPMTRHRGKYGSDLTRGTWGIQNVGDDTITGRPSHPNAKHCATFLAGQEEYQVTVR